MPAHWIRDHRGRAPRLLACALMLIAVAGCSGADRTQGGRRSGPLRVSGSTTVAPVAADAATALRAQGLEVTVDSQGGSAGGLAQLGADQIDIALSSKEVTDSEERQHPDTKFHPIKIGADAVGIIIDRAVYDGGVRSLNRDQLRRVFEGKVRSWRELGGPDLPVFVYDKEPGRGTREVLDKYLYADGEVPPPPSGARYAIVGGNEETRAKLLSTPGSVGPLSSAFVTGYPRLATVAVEGVQPSPEHIKDGTYPMARPLFLVTDGPPTGDAQRFVDYVLSAEGQELVAKHGYLTLADLGETPP
jgi:phosphate transport system substrate-binding protein